jgi:mono/diheme cytochrome c family protein
MLRIDTVMKRALKIVCVAASVAGGALLATGSAASGVPAYESVETVSSSRALYRHYCAECHGVDGKSQTPRGRETEADDLTTHSKHHSIEKLSRVIANGKGDMPGFKGQLKPAQIASIARYIKTL